MAEFYLFIISNLCDEIGWVANYTTLALTKNLSEGFLGHCNKSSLCYEIINSIVSVDEIEG